MFISVDFPEPDGPMIATSSPRFTSRSMPRSACTSVSPTRYTLVRPRISITRLAGKGVSCCERSLGAGSPERRGSAVTQGDPARRSPAMSPRPGGYAPASGGVGYEVELEADLGVDTGYEWD